VKFRAGQIGSPIGSVCLPCRCGDKPSPGGNDGTSQTQAANSAARKVRVCRAAIRSIIDRPISVPSFDGPQDTEISVAFQVWRKVDAAIKLQRHDLSATLSMDMG